MSTGDLFGLHHQAAALGERPPPRPASAPSLAARRPRGAEIVAPRPGPAAIRLPCSATRCRGRGARRRCAAATPRAASVRSPKASSRARCDGRVDQGPVVVLAMDLDETRADGAQELDLTGWSLTKARRPPILALDPAKDQVGLAADRRCPRGGARTGWSPATSKTAVTCALAGAVADEPAIAAPAEGQREGVEQDRLAGARSPVSTVRPPAKSSSAGRSGRCRGSQGRRACLADSAGSGGSSWRKLSLTRPPLSIGIDPGLLHDGYTRPCTRAAGKLWPSTAAAVWASRPGPWPGRLRSGAPALPRHGGYPEILGQPS